MPDLVLPVVGFALFPAIAGVVSKLVYDDGLWGLRVGGYVHLSSSAIAAIGCLAIFIKPAAGDAAQMGKGIGLYISGVATLALLASGAFFTFLGSF